MVKVNHSQRFIEIRKRILEACRTVPFSILGAWGGLYLAAPHLYHWWQVGRDAAAWIILFYSFFCRKEISKYKNVKQFRELTRLQRIGYFFIGISFTGVWVDFFHFDHLQGAEILQYGLLIGAAFSFVPPLLSSVTILCGWNWVAGGESYANFSSDPQWRNAVTRSLSKNSPEQAGVDVWLIEAGLSKMALQDYEWVGSRLRPPQ